MPAIVQSKTELDLIYERSNVGGAYHGNKIIDISLRVFTPTEAQDADVDPTSIRLEFPLGDIRFLLPLYLLALRLMKPIAMTIPAKKIVY